MDTSWLKYAAALLIIGAVVVFVKHLSHSKPQKTQPQEKTFNDVIKEDDERLRADVKPEPQAPSLETVRKTGTVPPPKTAQLQDQNKPESEEELPIEYEVQAQQLFELALTQRKMGRLPRVGNALTVKYCRRIINEFPKSSYAPKARAILRDLPEEERIRYNITDEEMGL
jgi:type IV secretory pathway VirB10-like protein